MKKEPKKQKLTDSPSCSDKEPIKRPLTAIDQNKYLEETDNLENSSDENYSENNS